ncbi:hypothetical protein M3J07_007508 [Ascochyta lentis]
MRTEVWHKLRVWKYFLLVVLLAPCCRYILLLPAWLGLGWVGLSAARISFNDYQVEQTSGPCASYQMAGCNLLHSRRKKRCQLRRPVPIMIRAKGPNDADVWRIAMLSCDPKSNTNYISQSLVMTVLGADIHPQGSIDLGTFSERCQVWMMKNLHSCCPHPLHLKWYQR